MTVQGDTIPYHDYYIFLINVHDGIALVLKSLKWMSRYCNVPPVFEHFSFPHLKTSYKGRKQHYRARRKEWPKVKETVKNRSLQFWLAVVSFCGNFREQLKMFDLVCALVYIKVDVEHHRCLSNYPSVGDGSVLPPTYMLTRRTRITGPWYM